LLRRSATNLDNCIGKSGNESISWIALIQVFRGCKPIRKEGGIFSRRKDQSVILEFRAESFQLLVKPPRLNEFDDAMKIASKRHSTRHQLEV
jgi:hypothetical protein